MKLLSPRRVLWPALVLAGLLLRAPLLAGETPSHTNPYQAQLSLVEARFNAPGTEPPEQAVLLRRAYQLRDYLDGRSALASFLEAAAANSLLHPLVRDEAQRHLAQIDLHLGNLADAERKYQALGMVRDWAIVGPFPTGDGLAATFGPERGYQPSEHFQDRSGKTLAWRTAPSAGPQLWLDLADFYPHAGSAVAFAATMIYSGAAQNVALRFTADSAYCLAVNGVQVADDQESRGVAFDQRTVGVRLRAGWNTVLFKLFRSSEGPWRFALRISRPEGGGLPLQESASQAWPAQPKIAAQDDSPVAVADLVGLAESAAHAQPSPSAPAREFLLGEIERDHAVGAPLEHMEHAARAQPTAERWLAVAELCADSSCQFAALHAALRAEPNSPAPKAALAGYYYGRGQLEKARDLYREALRLAPGDFVLRKRLADVYAAADLNALAAVEYQNLQREFPAPLWLKRGIAARDEGAGLVEQALALTTSALQENFDGAEERALLRRLLERRRDTAALEHAYDDAARLDPNYTLPRARLAALQSGAGRNDDAERTLRQALLIAPESDDLHRQLAQLFAGAGRSDASQRELAPTEALNSRQARSAARVDSHDSGAAADALESRYLVNAAELAAAAHHSPPAESASAVMLADVRVERVFANGQSAARVQQVFYVASAEGARRFSSQSVQYSPAAQELRLLHARVYKRDGRLVEGEDAGETATADAGVAMYYDARSRSIRFRNVEAGDVIELDYRLAPSVTVNPYGDYFGELMVFGSDLPQRLKRFALITPAARPLAVHEERMPAPAATETRGDQRIHCWEARDLPALANEPRAPAAAELAPYVHVSTFASWEELGRWYAQLIAPQFALDATLRQVLQHILAGKRTDAEKIRAIHHFVLRNTHYLALEFGIYGYKPYPVSQVYARRFGDCKDKASLMIALLRAAGIPADLALVRTRRMGRLADLPASIAIFNHAVVYLPRHDLWLDGTAEYAGAQELPIDDQGAMALTVAADGSAALRQIPLTQPLDNYSRRTVVAQVSADGNIRFSGASYTRGEDAPGLRRGYEIAERQLDFFRTRLAEVLPAVRVENVDVDGANDLEHEVSVKFRGTLDAFKGRKALSLNSTWLPRTYLQTLAPASSRTQELLLPAAWTTEEEIRYQLPAGAQWSFVPRDTSLETAFGSAAVRFERRGRELVVRTFVQFRNIRITPQQYGAFREFCSNVDRAAHNEIKVALGG